MLKSKTEIERGKSDCVNNFFEELAKSKKAKTKDSLHVQQKQPDFAVWCDFKLKFCQQATLGTDLKHHYLKY